MHWQIRHSSSQCYRNIIIKPYRHLKVTIIPPYFHAVTAGDSHPKKVCILSNLYPKSYLLCNPQTIDFSSPLVTDPQTMELSHNTLDFWSHPLKLLLSLGFLFEKEWMIISWVSIHNILILFFFQFGKIQSFSTHT